MVRRAFLDLGCLTSQTAQVVELAAAHIAPTLDLDLLDDWAIDWERTFHADAEAHLADGESRLDTGRVLGDHNTCEDLDTGPVSFNDPNVHFDAVTGPKFGDVVADCVGLDGLD